MKKSIFFTLPNLVSGIWQQTFADAVIADCTGDGYSGSPDLLCWVLTGVQGWEQLIQRLSSQGATVVALSLNESRAELLAALAAGARGYVHALVPCNTLKAIASAVQNGGLWLGHNFVNDLIRGISQSSSETSRPETDESEAPCVLDRLTTREREVCLLAAKAHSNKEIARLINITERTVKAHLGSSFEKLQVRDRVQLTLLVSRLSRSS